MSRRNYVISVAIEADGPYDHDLKSQQLFSAIKALISRGFDPDTNPHEVSRFVRDLKMYDRQTVIDVVFEEYLAKTAAKYI